MKSLMIMAAVAAVSIAAPAMAQDQPVSVYGTAGYANTDTDGANLGAIQADFARCNAPWRFQQADNRGPSHGFASA